MKIKNSLDLREYRLSNSGLIHPFDSVESCVKSHLGIQSQYTNSAFISILLRTKDSINLNDIYHSKKIIRAWVQRVTVHLIEMDDFFLINNLRKDEKCWVYDYIKNSDEVLKYINSLVYESGISAKILSERIKKEFGKDANDWSKSFILGNINELIYGKVSKDGILYQKFSDRSIKTSSWQVVFERYLKTYGPATLDDFSHWSGLNKTMLEKEIKTNHIQSLEYNKKIYYYTHQIVDKVEYPVILSKFDPLLVAYKDKSWILEEMDAKIVWRKAGQVEAVILDESGIIATWRMKCSQNRVAVTIIPVTNISKKMLNTIEHKFKVLMGRMNRKNFSFEMKRED